MALAVRHPLLVVFPLAFVFATGALVLRARWVDPSKGMLRQPAGSSAFALSHPANPQLGAPDNADSPIPVPIPASPRGRVHYFADGHSLSDPGSDNRQATWVCILNTGAREALLRFTFYFEDLAPVRMSHQVPPKTTRSIKLYNREEIPHNKRFGGKIESSVPVVIQVTTGYYGNEDKEDWYTRAMHSVVCNDTIANVNYYADGVIVRKRGLRLRESEWVYMLNPNLAPARVQYTAYTTDGKRVSFPLTIQPQRVFALALDDLLEKNKLFGAEVRSSVPLAVQQTRVVEEIDRRTIRSAYSVMAKPGGLFQDAAAK